MPEVESLNERTGVDDEFAKTAMSQFFDLYFIPEMRRRLEAGAITKDHHLQVGQVIFSTKGVEAIRLDSEVRGVILVTDRPDLDPNRPVTEEDLRGFRGFDLEEDERNYGHITVFRVGQGWVGAFNALQGRVQVSQLLDRAQRFLDASFDAEIKGHLDVASDTLFSACELMSKSVLILHTQFSDDNKKHAMISKRINYWRKLGNIDADFVKLFNRLTNDREFFRYSVSDDRPVTLPPMAIEIAAAQLLHIREMSASRVDALKEQSAQRTTE